MRNGRLFITGFYLYYKEEEKVEIGRRRARRRKKERKGLVALPPPASLYCLQGILYENLQSFDPSLLLPEKLKGINFLLNIFFRQGNLDCLSG